MRNLCFVVGLLFLVTVAQSQQVQSVQLELEIKKAKLSFDIKKYNTAANLYKKLYTKIRNEELQNEMLYMVAESYRRANNFKQAFDWYEKLVNTKYPDTRIIFSYGLLLKNFERYEDANRQFNDYLFEVPGDKNALREIEACKQAQQWKANPQKFNVKELSELNTVFSDYSPFYSQGKLLWASSRNEAMGNEIFEWTGQKCSDFFQSDLSGKTWSKPINIKGAVNTNFNEGAGWLDSTGTTLYFTQCNGSTGNGLNCKIYVSYNQNNNWSTPKVLPFCSDSFSTGHPAMSPDGKRLFFASDMQGGFGEKDIYYIPYNVLNDSWGKPINLGASVNTNEDDMFPYAATDGSIYFASKGWPGMGGLDLYKTADSAGTFKKAVNLQSPINSGGDDFSISFVSTSEIKNSTDPIAYFSSNRQGGKGDDDVYAIAIKPFVFKLIGKVFDKETNQPLPQAIVMVDDTASKNVYSITTDENGAFSSELPISAISAVSAFKSGYFKSNISTVNSIGTQTDSSVVLNFFLDPIPTQEYEFTLKGIYYDVDKFDIRPDAAKILDSLVAILKANPAITIELGSHTDSRAPEDYNLKLSQKRAQSCVDYLTKNGIEKSRLTAVGYGETKLMNDCADGVDCTEEQHQENRRTTFRVLSTDYKNKR